MNKKNQPTIEKCHVCNKKLKHIKNKHIDSKTGREIYICDNCQDSIDRST